MSEQLPSTTKTRARHKHSEQQHQLGKSACHHKSKQDDLYWLQATLIIALVTLVFSWSAFAAASNLTEYPTITKNDIQKGTLAFQRTDGSLIEAPILDTRVDMHINGQIAYVTVTQTFNNPTHQWLEGIYLFPLPSDSAVNQLRILIGDQEIIGEIQEKKKAKALYTKAKVAGKKASLITQERPNLFTNSVANIPPQQNITVKISYLETVPFRDDKFSIRFPLTLTPRFQPSIDQTDSIDKTDITKESPTTSTKSTPPQLDTVSPPFNNTHDKNRNLVSFNINIDAGGLLETIKSTYHPIDIRRTGRRYKITLDDKTTIANKDFELIWEAKASNTPNASLFYEKMDNYHFYTTQILPPASNLETALDKETIFIIDTSGSMSGDSIKQAKKALLLALDQLSASDRFNIIEFNSHMNSLFNGLTEKSQKNLNTAKQFVTALSANGGTNMAPALSTAFNQMQSTFPPEAASNSPSTTPSESVKQVIFITDGSIGNEANLFALIEQNIGNTRLFTIGIGSAPNSYFMEKAASFGKGTFTYIGKTKEISQKMLSLFAKINRPLLTNIQLTISDNQHVEIYPTHIPDLYSGEPLTLAIKSNKPIEQVNITGKITGTSWKTTLSPALSPRNFKRSNRWPKNSTNTPLQPHRKTLLQSKGVASLWARRKISQLSSDLVTSHQKDLIKQEIINTSMTHHIVSKYTSLIAVEKNVSRDKNTGLYITQVANQLPHGNTMSPHYTSAPQTATNATQSFMLGLLCLSLALILRILTARRSTLGITS